MLIGPVAPRRKALACKTLWHLQSQQGPEGHTNTANDDNNFPEPASQHSTVPLAPLVNNRSPFRLNRPAGDSAPSPGLEAADPFQHGHGAEHAQTVRRRSGTLFSQETSPMVAMHNVK